MAADGVERLTGWRAARFGVYVHFPWCLHRCPYCDFAVSIARKVPEERYADAVVAELGLRLEAWPTLRGRALDSVFLGGGTPSLWAPSLVGRVLEALAREFQLAADAEVSLEANPNAADAGRFVGYRAAGVTRLSIGVQSFEDSTLKALGRDHDGAAAEHALDAARRAGFDNVSMDFIYGVHGQTLAQARADARRAAALGTEHLSAYALTLEREALAQDVVLAKQLARGELHLPPDETVADMARAIQEAYGSAGLQRYEVSNFARPGFHSRHNSLYWTGGEYLALGAGATGFLVTGSPLPLGEGEGEGVGDTVLQPVSHGTGVTPGLRYANHRSADKYMTAVESGRLPEESREELGTKERFEERLSLGLRLESGIDLERLCAEAGESYAKREPTVRMLKKHGLATGEGGQLALTPAGLAVHSAVCARLI
ncbi:MAG: radical SAM family heme chaperone HemW [Myxococcaceae bacterium]|nr:radical SAM family heme chaperone HemW [Myxococcaceae bacterium]